MFGSLPDELFDPLQLDEALSRAYTIGGRPAVTDLLERVLGDPRSHRDERESVYLDELIERYEEAGRYAEAVTVAYRMLDRAETWERPRVLGQIAQLYVDNGETSACRTVLDRAAAEIRVRSNRQLVLSAFFELATMLEERLNDPRAAIELIERVLNAAKPRRDRSRDRDRSDIDCLAQLHCDIAQRANLRVADLRRPGSRTAGHRTKDDPADATPALDWWSEITRTYPAKISTRDSQGQGAEETEGS
jgi:hypothetical protein